MLRGSVQGKAGALKISRSVFFIKNNYKPLERSTKRKSQGAAYLKSGTLASV
jgi:hypothetical protein